MRNPSSRGEEYIIGSQNDVIVAAEAKLERPLTSREQAGIKRVRSTMTLEFIYMKFTHQHTTPDLVKSEIDSFLRDLDAEQNGSNR